MNELNLFAKTENVLIRSRNRVNNDFVVRPKVTIGDELIVTKLGSVNYMEERLTMNLLIALLPSD